MDNKTRISNLAEEKYLVLFWVRKATFNAMLCILEEAYEQMRQKGGRKRKLSVLDMLIIMFGYCQDYLTMENIAFDYGVHKQRISKAVTWVEQILIKDTTFSLPSKRELLKADTEIIVAIVDVIECKTERQKKQKESCSVKQKCHTIKNLLVINGLSGKIICLDEAKGSVHDFEIFKQSRIHLHKDILLIGDKGFQGICSLHALSLIPSKKPRNGTLTPEQKAFNSTLLKFRIFIEHINRRIKRFKILQMRYRNKQRKHLLRVSLICGIYNIEL